MTDWYHTTKSIQTIEAEICFLLQTNYGGEVLPSPNIPRQVKPLIGTGELVGHEVQLAAYYKQILELARRDGKAFDEISSYFWMRLFFWNSDAGVHITFPWYDTYSEMKPLLDKILSDGSGELFWDRDQGWEINIDTQAGRIYIREWNPDDEEIHTLANFPKTALEAIIPPLMSRAEKTIEVLSRLLGEDVWTKRVKKPSFHQLIT